MGFFSKLCRWIAAKVRGDELVEARRVADRWKTSYLNKSAKSAKMKREIKNLKTRRDKLRKEADLAKYELCEVRCFYASVHRDGLRKIGRAHV